MRKPLILALGVVCAAALHAAPPTDASLDTLLTITRAGKLMEDMQGTIDQSLEQSMRQSLHREQPTPAQQKVIDQTRKKLSATLREELAWDKMRPMYFTIYKDTLTQEEVDGMIAFYKTPAGQAVIDKMPLVMQKTMTVMQTDFMPQVMNRVRPILLDGMMEMRAAGKR